MSREDDAKRYVELHPEGEAKTVRVEKNGRLIPFWICRPIKGQGPWLALPNYTDGE